MFNLIKSELEYNIGTLIFASLAIIAVLATGKYIFDFETLGTTSFLGNVFLILIISNAIKLISEKRTRMQIPLSVKSRDVAMARIGFFFCFQTILTAVLLIANLFLKIDLYILEPTPLFFINIQFLIISTFIMLHNSLGFFNRFKYRTILYCVPVLIIIFVIIFFGQITSFLEACKLPEYYFIVLSVGVWLALTSVYVASFERGASYTEQ